ncbi:transcription factor TFIIIB component B'' homolog isoform X2 [Rhineura floridana]|uniref:transcription factor TFIIIB component B'' homolog isoform X2 n=1 Tax=Rhineura floridana TaxID=261503 RepID=UPI002AC82267|nr:transcription factor TFIIIB component B'' homolog isoform X2 [Rhineura floridana]
MFRRARFSVKPNVRPSAAARGNCGGGGTTNSSVIQAAATAPDAGARHGSTLITCSSAAVGESTLQSGAATAAENLQQDGGNSDSTRNEKTNASDDGDCIRHAETPVQRRKRISTMPNLAKLRVSSQSTQRAASLASKCSQKQVPHSPIIGNSPLQKELPSPEKVNVESSPTSPILPEKKTPVPQVPQFSPFKKSASKEPNACVTAQRSDEALQKNTSSPLKERPTQERLIEEEIPQSKSIPAKEKICSDREKIIKAQKLRKMLKEELKKEKQQQKYKCPVIEKNTPEDRSKMIMRDFIYYLPENNPMKSSLVEEKKIEKTSTVTQAKEPEIVVESENEEAEDDDEEEEGVEDDGPLLVPRVKVAEDGSIILDEESLTVEVLRTKGQCVVEENDPIFERGSTTTYSSFRKSYYTKPWSEKETDMFFLAISMVGTDFSMISQLFPHRARTEIKNKFKREEKANGWRIDKAFKEKKPFDFGCFTKLLEKVLENERRKKEKDAKCQHQKEKNPNEKRIPKSQKKRKAKVANGQTNHDPDDPQNARNSDAEMEVDADTAEKENEESPSILEQTEGQTVTESAVAKKKRKRKKKDSEQEAENLPDERSTSAEAAEEERSRKKRKNTSSSVENNGIEEVGEELEVADGKTPAKTLLQCCVQVNEDTEGDLSPALSSIQVLIEAEPGELDVSEANFEHHTEQPSVSHMSPNTNKEGFEENSAAKNEAAELNKLDEYIPLPSCDEELMEIDVSATEKPTEEEQLQRLASKTSEEREPLASDTSEVSPSEVLGDAEKSIVEDKAANISGPIIEEKDRASNDRVNDFEKTQKAAVGKTEVRGRRQKLKPNIVKALGRKEAPLQGKLDKPEADVTIEKSNDQCDAPSITTEEAAGKDCQVLDTEFMTSKQSTSQESNKQTVLKPALLARGRMPRPKPNLGRVARRQREPARNTETEQEKATEAAVESEKILIQPECSSSELPTNITEVTSYEADMPHCDVLENKAVASTEKVILAHGMQSPVKTLLEYESHKLKNTLLASNSMGDVADLATRGSRLQQEEKEISAEIEYSLMSPKKNLEKAAEREESLRAEKEVLGNEHKTEIAANVMSENSKSSHLDEAAMCGILPSSLLLGERSMDASEAAATNTTHLSSYNLSDFKSNEPNEVLLSSDIQEKITFGKQSTIQPTLLLRGRFQRPKPNIGRAVGRKETQYVGNEARAAFGTEISELQKSKPTRTPSVVTHLKWGSKALPVETLENRLIDMENVIQEDPWAPSTSQNISYQQSREKPTFQENKPCAIKPAQLVRGRFQRVRPNLGRMNDKKEEPVIENVTAPVEGEIGKTDMDKKSDLYPPSEGNLNVQPSLSDLGKKEQSESSEAQSPKICIDQKKNSSPEKPQKCEFPKDQKETIVLKDVEGTCLDIHGSDISAPCEICPSKSIKSIQLMRRPLQKPKPSLARVAKKNEASSKGEASTEDKTGSDTQSKTTLCCSKSGKMDTLMHKSGKLVEAASSSECSRQRNHIDRNETLSPTRSRYSGKCDSSEQSSGSGSQIRKEISEPLSVQERASERIKGQQAGQTLKQRKNACGSRMSSALECENDHSKKGKRYLKLKPNVSRGRSLKPVLRKKPKKEYGNSKVNLVTLRASSQEEEEDDDDWDDFEPDYEVECFSPEEVNKAPVFVPKGLRSPNPVPIQIEETMEELEIYENVAVEPFLSHEMNVVSQPVMLGDKEPYSSQVVIAQEEQEKKTGISDGSTEAAMTLLAMRDPVFQLSTGIQGKMQEFSPKDEMNVADHFPNEHNEEQSVIHCDVSDPAPSENESLSSDNTNKTATEDHGNEPSGMEDYLQEAANVSLSASSKNEPVSSYNMNKAAPEYCNTSGLEECFQETTSISSDLMPSTGNKSSKLARCRFPKPKPNLNTGLRLTRNVPQKSLGLSSYVEQSKEIQNEKKVSENETEEQKVEVEQNLRLDEVTNSSSGEKQDLQLASAGPAMQKDNMERENMVRETWEVASETTAPKLSPEADPPEPPSDHNTNVNVQVGAPVEHQLSAVKFAQTEAAEYPSISSTAEMTAVVSDPKAEEEPTFILTLVEISPGSENCNDISGLQQEVSEELLPAPIFCTTDNMDSMELTREDNLGSLTAAIEENAVSVASTSKTGGLQAASLGQWTDLGSTPWKNLKKCAVALEESGSCPEKKRLPPSPGENLKSSNKNSWTSNEAQCWKIQDRQKKVLLHTTYKQ